MQCMSIGYQILIAWDILLKGTATVWSQGSILLRDVGFFFGFDKSVSGFCTVAVAIVK